MNSSPYKNAFLTSNDFCSMQKSKYERLDTSFKKNDFSNNLDNTIPHYSSNMSDLTNNQGNNFNNISMNGNHGNQVNPEEKP